MPETYQTLHERVLNVLAQRNVDDVIIGVPNEITDAILDGYKIEKVIMSLEATRGEIPNPDSHYSVAQSRGILH
jgi:glycerol-3-phosphate cytidylyltransferase-like family protein